MTYDEYLIEIIKFRMKEFGGDLALVADSMNMSVNELRKQIKRLGVKK